MGVTPWKVSYEQGVKMMKTQNNWDHILSMTSYHIDQLDIDIKNHIKAITNNLPLDETCSKSSFVGIPGISSTF